MPISINQISSGIGLMVENQIYLVMDYDHVKPAKGSAFVRVKMKNIKTGSVLERTFRTADKLDDVPLEERRMQYLYRSGDEFHFMDQESYEETTMMAKDLDETFIKLLQDNLEVTAICYHQVLKMVLPNFMICQITDTEPGIRGDSSRSGTKPATIDTGATILVPLFINKGDWVKIDTRTGGEYVERVQK